MNFLLAVITAIFSFNFVVVTRASAHVTAVPEVCENVFYVRARIVETRPRPTRSHLIARDRPAHSIVEWMRRLEASGQLVYQGRHRYAQRGQYLASNEADWAKTPFDGRLTDLLVAFGTNSAWEIAVNKNARKIVLADWSPNPIAAQAYVLAPLIRISKTPQELILNLAGKTSPEYERMPIEVLLRHWSERMLLTESEISLTLEKFARSSEIRDDELEFLASFFWSRLKPSTNEFLMWADQSPQIRPFDRLEHFVFADFVTFLGFRYRETPAPAQSVLQNPELYARLRTKYRRHDVQYAITEVADLAFYQTLRLQNPLSRDLSLSLTNIFDMPYAGHSFKSLQQLLRSIMGIYDISEKRPLTVFRTTGIRQPHGFYRYDIESTSDIPSTDAVDSFWNSADYKKAQ